jgi:DNA polymerase IV
VQIKIRYSDFSTFTRARTLDHATQLDTEIAGAATELFAANWTGQPVRLIGVYAQGLEHSEGQMSLLEEEKTRRWRDAMSAVDRIRDRFGESSVSLARSLQSDYHERVHENPENLPGKEPRGKS